MKHKPKPPCDRDRALSHVCTAVSILTNIGGVGKPWIQQALKELAAAEKLLIGLQGWPMTDSERLKVIETAVKAMLKREKGGE